MLKNNVEVNKLTISVRSHISYERIANLLDSASRGADYWASGVSSLGFESNIQRIFNGGFVAIKLQDDEFNGKDRGFHLDMARIKKGFTVMAKKEPSHFADFIAENDDQTTADVFLQCCLLGEVIYG